MHALAYFLNPKFYFSDSFRVDEEVMAGVIACIDNMAPDPKLRDKVLDELEVRFDICNCSIFICEFENVHY